MATSKSIADIKTLKGGGDPIAERAQKLKSDWNLYQQYLQKRGLAGHPSLDKGAGDQNVGIQYVKQFQKENPGTLISPETIPEVQRHFQNYREYTLNQLRTGKAMISDAQNPKGRYVKPDEKLDNYMKDLSTVDGIPGSKTSSHSFPSSFLTTIYKAPTGQIEKQTTVNQGLVQ